MQPRELGGIERVGRARDGDRFHIGRDRRVGERERGDGVVRAELLAQLLEAAAAARRGGVADLPEGDRGPLRVGERPNVRREAVLEVVGLLDEGDGLDGVRVPDRQAEIAFFHLQLPLSQDVELHRGDAARAGLALRGAVGRRILDDELHLAAPRRAVVAQQVVHVALCGLDLLGQGAGHEQLDGDEVRQRAQQLPGGRRERERPAGRQVDPAADVSAEQVHDDDAHGEQHGGQAEALKRLAARRELAGEQGEVREHEEQGRERHEVHGVAQVDHAAGDLAEMRQHAERAGDGAEAGRQSHEQLVQSHEDQQEHHEDPDNERRDLVLAHARCPHADGGQSCDEQGGAHVLGHHDAELGRGPEREPERDRESDREGDEQEQHLTAVLAEQQLELRDRLRQHDLERTRAHVFRQRPHRHGRHQEQQQPGKEVEHRPQGRDVVDLHLAEEQQRVHAREHDEQDVGDGLVEQRLHLASRDGADRAHVTAPADSSAG